MSKVAAYLRGHISGEVSSRGDVRDAMSIDTGVLKIKPEMVIYPRTTNDIRKIVRFAWQLAEKGHVLPVTVRGAGTDPTGAAIGKGVSIVTTAHMNQIYEYDSKQKLVRLQPGASIHSLTQALSLYGAGVLSLAGSQGVGTIGGAIGGGVSGLMAGKYGDISKAISKLEVVLSNGDAIQTGRISKHELNRRKGLQGFEGDIYRGIDSIIEDNDDTFNTIQVHDATGYNSIADVKHKDGSFDLTPLFVGSQGTLGIVSEMILKAEFRSVHLATVALVYSSAEVARDGFDAICKMTPAFVEYFDATLFDNALARGKTYSFYQKSAESTKPACVVLVGFDDFSQRHREKHLKKLTKMFAKTDVHITTSDSKADSEIMAACDIAYYTLLPDTEGVSAPPIFSGFNVPRGRFEDFSNALRDLAGKLHLDLPLAGHVSTGVYSVYPSLQLSKVSDKQKVFKLLDELTKLVIAHGGAMISEGGEGRLKGKFVYAQLDEKLVTMYRSIKDVCDPRGILNPGVKADTDIRHLAEHLRDSRDAGQLARFGL